MTLLKKANPYSTAHLIKRLHASAVLIVVDTVRNEDVYPGALEPTEFKAIKAHWPVVSIRIEDEGKTE